MKNFFRAMVACKDTIFEKKDRAAADVYLKVKAFVEEGSYTNCKKARSLAEMRLRGLDAHVIAEHFGVAYNTIRTELKRMSKDLWGIFPEDFLDKLSDYRTNKQYVDEIIKSLDYLSVRAEDLLLMDVVRVLRVDAGGETYSLADCTEEVDFLKRYSKAFFDEDLHTVDKDKLRYLISILDGSTTVVERAKLIGVLGGNNNA